MVFVCSELYIWLVGGTMWMSDTSHTCPSETNSMLMIARTVVRPVAVATVCCLKDILLWCDGVCEGCRSEGKRLQNKVQHFRLPDTPVATCNNVH